MSAHELITALPMNGLAAAATALTVAPLIACFDEAITRSAAGENLWVVLAQRLCNICAHPIEFFTSAAFAWVWIVYAATYATSNVVGPLKIGFAATIIVTLVNMTCGIAKDSAYAKMFSSSSKDPGAKTKTPIPAFLIWFCRDLLSFTFVLTLPEVISKAMQVDLSLTKFATPVIAQYFTTPLHLMGLSFVNDPGSTFGKHLKAAFCDGYLSTVTARQMRIIPPYSVGGLLNGWILSLGESRKSSSAPKP